MRALLWAFVVLNALCVVMNVYVWMLLGTESNLFFGALNVASGSYILYVLGRTSDYAR